MAACLQGQQLSRRVTSTTRSRGCQESEEVPGFAVAVGEVVPRSGRVMVCRPMCLSPRTVVQPIQALVMSRRYFRFVNAFLHILQSVYHWWCVYRVRLNLILTDTILRSQTPLPVSPSHSHFLLPCTLSCTHPPIFFRLERRSTILCCLRTCVTDQRSVTWRNAQLQPSQWCVDKAPAKPRESGQHHFISSGWSFVRWCTKKHRISLR